MKDKYRSTFEITDGQVKILQARIQRGLPVVFRSFVKDITETTPEELPAIVKEGAGTHSKGGRLILVIPRRFVTVKLMSLPSDSPAEIQRMLDLQIHQQIPFAREDIVYCHAIVGQDAQGYSKILVQIVQKEIVERYLNVLSSAHLSCQNVVLTSIGILSWYRANILARVQHKNDAVIILDIDRSCSELCIVQGDRLLFSRYLPFGHQDILKGGGGDYLQQIQMTVETYARERMGSALSRFYILSDRPVVSLQRQLETSGIPGVEVISPRGISMRQKKDRQPQFTDQEDLSFTASLGCLGLPVFEGMNLIPAEIIQSKSSKVKRKELFKFWAVLTSACILLWVAFNLDNYQKGRQLAAMKAEIKAIQPDVRKAEETIQSIEFLKDKIQDRTILVEIIKRLFLQVPEPISLRSLQLDHQGTIILLGFGESRSSVNQFHNNLVDSAIFQKVALEYATERKRFKEEYVEFKIVCQLSHKESVAP